MEDKIENKSGHHFREKAKAYSWLCAQEWDPSNAWITVCGTRDSTQDATQAKKVLYLLY